jgi:hypothetical protein
MVKLFFDMRDLELKAVGLDLLVGVLRWYLIKVVHFL